MTYLKFSIQNAHRLTLQRVLQCQDSLIYIDFIKKEPLFVNIDNSYDFLVLILNDFRIGFDFYGVL